MSITWKFVSIVSILLLTISIVLSTCKSCNTNAAKIDTSWKDTIEEYKIRNKQQMEAILGLQASIDSEVAAQYMLEQIIDSQNILITKSKLRYEKSRIGIINLPTNDQLKLFSNWLTKTEPVK